MFMPLFMFFLLLTQYFYQFHQCLRAGAVGNLFSQFAKMEALGIGVLRSSPGYPDGSYFCVRIASGRAGYAGCSNTEISIEQFANRLCHDTHYVFADHGVLFNQFGRYIQQLLFDRGVVTDNRAFIELRRTSMLIE